MAKSSNGLALESRGRHGSDGRACWLPWHSLGPSGFGHLLPGHAAMRPMPQAARGPGGLARNVGTFSLHVCDPESNDKMPFSLLPAPIDPLGPYCPFARRASDPLAPPGWPLPQRQSPWAQNQGCPAGTQRAQGFSCGSCRCFLVGLLWITLEGSQAAWEVATALLSLLMGRLPGLPE